MFDRSSFLQSPWLLSSVMFDQPTCMQSPWLLSAVLFDWSTGLQSPWLSLAPAGLLCCSDVSCCVMLCIPWLSASRRGQLPPTCTALKYVFWYFLAAACALSARKPLCSDIPTVSLQDTYVTSNDKRAV